MITKSIINDQITSIKNVTFTKRKFNNFNDWIDYVWQSVDKPNN